MDRSASEKVQKKDIEKMFDDKDLRIIQMMGDITINKNKLGNEEISFQFQGESTFSILFEKIVSPEILNDYLKERMYEKINLYIKEKKKGSSTINDTEIRQSLNSILKSKYIDEFISFINSNLNNFTTTDELTEHSFIKISNNLFTDLICEENLFNIIERYISDSIKLYEMMENKKKYILYMDYEVNFPKIKEIYNNIIKNLHIEYDLNELSIFYLLSMLWRINNKLPISNEKIFLNKLQLYLFICQIRKKITHNDITKKLCEKIDEKANILFAGNFQDGFIEYMDKNRELTKRNIYDELFYYKNVKPKSHQVEFLNKSLENWDKGFFTTYSTVMGSGKTTSVIAMSRIATLKGKKLLFLCNSFLVKTDILSKLKKYNDTLDKKNKTNNIKYIEINNENNEDIGNSINNKSVIVTDVESGSRILNEPNAKDEFVLFFDELTMGTENIESDELQKITVLLTKLPKRTILSSATLPQMISLNNNAIHLAYKIYNNTDNEITSISRSEIEIACQMNTFNSTPYSIFYQIKTQKQLEKFILHLTSHYYYRRFCTFDDMLNLYIRMKNMGINIDGVKSLDPNNCYLWDPQAVAEIYIKLLNILLKEDDNIICNVCKYQYTDDIIDINKFIQNIDCQTLFVTNEKDISLYIANKEILYKKMLSNIQKKIIFERGEYRDFQDLNDMIKMSLNIHRKNIQMLENIPESFKMDEMFDLLNHGIAFFNKSTHAIYNKLVYDLAKSNKIILLVADSTISYGVNFPIENIVIFDNVAEESSVELLCQISGRAGRKGLSKKANVFMSNKSLHRFYQYAIDGSDKIYNEGMNLELSTIRNIAEITKNLSVEQQNRFFDIKTKLANTESFSIEKCSRYDVIGDISERKKFAEEFGKINSEIDKLNGEYKEPEEFINTLDIELKIQIKKDEIKNEETNLLRFDIAIKSINTVDLETMKTRLIKYNQIEFSGLDIGKKRKNENEIKILYAKTLDIKRTEIIDKINSLNMELNELEGLILSAMTTSVERQRRLTITKQKILLSDDLNTVGKKVCYYDELLKSNGVTTSVDEPIITTLNELLGKNKWLVDNYINEINILLIEIQKQEQEKEMLKLKQFDEEKQKRNQEISAIVNSKRQEIIVLQSELDILNAKISEFPTKEAEISKLTPRIIMVLGNEEIAGGILNDIVHYIRNKRLLQFSLNTLQKSSEIKEYLKGITFKNYNNEAKNKDGILKPILEKFATDYINIQIEKQIVSEKINSITEKMRTIEGEIAKLELQLQTGGNKKNKKHDYVYKCNKYIEKIRNIMNI
jgi:hypothetical protein